MPTCPVPAPETSPLVALFILLGSTNIMCVTGERERERKNNTKYDDIYSLVMILEYEKLDLQ